MKFNTSINPLDISDLLQKVIHYSNRIMKQCVGVLHDMKYFIKEFAISLFKYIHVFLIVAVSLLGITLLFSKNKLGNLLVLMYVFMNLFMVGLIIGVIALIVICIEKTIELFKKILQLIKIEKKISIKSVIAIIFVILGIFLFLIEFGIILGFLVFIALVIDFLFGMIRKLFNVINGVYSKTSLAAESATTAIDSFGTMIRKGFENC